MTTSVCQHPTAAHTHHFSFPRSRCHSPEPLRYATAPQTHYCLRSLLVPVYWQLRAWLNGIQHSLTTIRIRISQIKINSQSGTVLSLFRQTIKYCLCNLHTAPFSVSFPIVEQISNCRTAIMPLDISYHLSRILHLLPKHRTNYHLYVLDE